MFWEMKRMEKEQQPRIYVGDYASYNAGYLYGRWLELAGKSAAEIRREISAILKENSRKLGAHCEEAMYQEFEGFPRAFYHESCLDFDLLAQFLNLDSGEREQVEAYLEHDPSPEAAMENYESVLIWDSFADLIEQRPLWDEIPPRYHYLINTLIIERELRMEANFIDLPGGRIAEIDL